MLLLLVLAAGILTLVGRFWMSTFEEPVVPANAWTPCIPPGAGFESSMPGFCSLEMSSVSDGEDEVGVWTVSGAGDGIECYIRWLDLEVELGEETEASESLEMFDTDGLLEGAANAMSEGGEDVLVSIIFQQGLGGREVSWRDIDSDHYARLFVAQGRLYQIVAVLPRGAKPDAATRLFENFRFVTAP